MGLAQLIFSTTLRHWRETLHSTSQSCCCIVHLTKMFVILMLVTTWCRLNLNLFIPFSLFRSFKRQNKIPPLDTVPYMTTPKKFSTNVIETMVYLDNVLPRGSHVVFVGLLDGSFWWETLYSKQHLLGHGVTYARFWHWLSCLQSNPCEGWLTSQDNIRAFTSSRLRTNWKNLGVFFFDLWRLIFVFFFFLNFFQ